jgi:hypothetical protein
MALVAATDRMALGFALDSVRANGVRSFLAVAGIVIGIVTVVLITSVLSNAKNQVRHSSRDWARITCWPSTSGPIPTLRPPSGRRTGSPWKSASPT